jgi:predicted nucleotidyltransferase
MVGTGKLDPMRPSEALALHRTQIREIAMRHRVSDVRVFGSALHGDDTTESDLDLLVDTLPGATLFDLGGLQDELQELLGLPVDVLTLKDLPIKFRYKVASKARPV